MSNLLPDSYLKQLLRNFRARFILVGSLLSVAAALVSVLALLPGFIMLYSTRPDTVPASQNSEQSKKDAIEAGTIQLLTKQYAPLLSVGSTTNAVFQALSVKPQKIHIDHISYSFGEASVLILSGVAENRSAINEYKEALSHGELFKSVSVPVGDLVGALGGKFRITLVGNF